MVCPPSALPSPNLLSLLLVGPLEAFEGGEPPQVAFNGELTRLDYHREEATYE